MAKCLDCGSIFCYYGGSEGHSCPTCESYNIDASMEISYKDKNEEKK